MKIRQLFDADWDLWKEIRLEALNNSPESFGSSYEEEVLMSDADFQNRLSKGYVLGAFVDDLLVSCAGFYKLNSLKTKHRGVIWGMYTRLEYRGKGIATALIQNLIQHAKTCVTQLHLTCVTNNFVARDFYQKQGFRIYGTEPKALKINDTFYDEYLMVLDFKEEPMKKLDTYLNLCTEVYDLSKPNAPQDAYSFYRSYAVEAKGPILEPMCGTGRFLLPLAEEGFDVYGFDASQPMLERLHAKASSKNLNPKVWHGFIEDLKQSDKYSFIFIPSGSFSLITEKADIQKALKTIYEHMEDKGLFVFEVETRHAVPKELGTWRGTRWQREDGALIVLSQAILDEEACYSIGKYELIDNNHVIQTEVEEYKIRIYQDPSFLLTLLTEVGFSNVRTVKAFDRNASPDETDESIVFECRK
ncbi:TPA: GNAT family N-acetyltransferase [Legionella pneumophila]|nr:GNAT family N-acetyltransferase [Legionella pneumophila subsp. pneumophila]HAU0214338.1 GNAT family N-acetyltransferase [Legionella pneumophila]HAT8905934.1 GNAT family N-acetyltransferase [Legionella pneumophila subsp. pneumophila]HAU1084044.1 GNAT family N-acetyltransferase [Legionella pneumophila]HAU1118282.1 GNAT family N-acetyltransferase [Legionella pneumophila]